MTASSLLPSDWKVVPLSQLLKSAQSGFASGARDPNGVVQMRMNNVTTDGNLDWTNFIRVPASQKQLDKYRLRVGDVLFNSTNSPNLVGKTAVFDGFPEPVVFSNHFVRMRVDETRLDPWYLARWLTDQWQHRVFESLCTQWVNQAAVRKDDLLSLKVPLPPLPEQQRTAAILVRADRLRRLRRTARELSDTYLQSVFLEMFGDPVSNPRGWNTAKLTSQVKHIDSGWSPVCGETRTSEEQWAILRLGAVTTGTYLPGENKQLLPGFEPRPKLEVKKGDVLITRKNTIDLVAACAFVHSTPPRLMLPDTIFRFVFRENIKVRPEYLWGLFSENAFRRAVQSLATGTAGSMPNISKEKLLGVAVPLPPIPLQQQFAHIVHKFERLRAQQREAERQAEHLFQTLLHRAFRGEL